MRLPVGQARQYQANLLEHIVLRQDREDVGPWWYIVSAKHSANARTQPALRHVHREPAVLCHTAMQLPMVKYDLCMAQVCNIYCNIRLLDSSGWFTL